MILKGTHYQEKILDNVQTLDKKIDKFESESQINMPIQSPQKMKIGNMVGASTVIGFRNSETSQRESNY